MLDAVTPQWISLKARKSGKPVYRLSPMPIVVIKGALLWPANDDDKVPTIGIKITEEEATAIRDAVDKYIVGLFPTATSGGGDGTVKKHFKRAKTEPIDVWLPIKTREGVEGAAASVQLPFDRSWADYYRIVDEDTVSIIKADELRLGRESEVEFEISPFIFEKDGETKHGLNFVLKKVVQEEGEAIPRKVELSDGRKLTVA
jgi:hypothetical protein